MTHSLHKSRQLRAEMEARHEAAAPSRSRLGEMLIASVQRMIVRWEVRNQVRAAEDLAGRVECRLATPEEECRLILEGLDREQEAEAVALWEARLELVLIARQLQAAEAAAAQTVP